ncbi:MAG: DUF1289 domain-containing protein [Sphingomonas sp.]
MANRLAFTGVIARTTPVAVDSPCINLCSLDPQTGFCEGCGRTIAEISGWLSGTAEWRSAVMEALPQRLNARHD